MSRKTMRTIPLVVLACGCLGELCTAFSTKLAKNDQKMSQTVLQSVDSIHAIGEFYNKSPTEAAMITCAAKASGADLVAQFRQRGKAFEMDRMLGFLIYGAFYQGLAQHFIYNHLFTEMFGDGRDPLIVATKVLFDMAIVAPNLPLPLSYSTKSVISGNSVGEGLRKYVDDVVHQDLLFKYWGFWTPIQALSFSVVPDHLRIPFMAAFSFLWMTILSTTMSCKAQDATTTSTADNDTAEWFSQLSSLPHRIEK